jgi:hypothetical protein
VHADPPRELCHRHWAVGCQRFAFKIGGGQRGCAEECHCRANLDEDREYEGWRAHVWITEEIERAGRVLSLRA